MNFKKQISVYVALLILTLNSGVSFNVHYCKDTVASVTLNAFFDFKEKGKTCCDKLEKPSKCCHNKVIKASDKLEQVLAKNLHFNLSNFVLPSAEETAFYQSKAAFKNKEKAFYCCDAHGPPSYLLYHQLTFYS